MKWFDHIPEVNPNLTLGLLHVLPVILLETKRPSEPPRVFNFVAYYQLGQG